MKHRLALLGVLALAAPAHAGGPVAAVAEPAPAAAAPAPGHDWTGFYVGLSAIGGTFSDNGGVTSDGTDGFGVHAGYLRDLGTFVVGGELSYASGDYDFFVTNEWNAMRAKLIGGFDAGRFLPYGFIGLSSYDVTGASEFSDTVTIYGIGAKMAVTQRISAGLEYMVEDKDEFDGGFDMENSELSLRLDYRF